MIRPSLRIQAVGALTASLLGAGLLTAAPASANAGVSIETSGLRPDGGSTTALPQVLSAVANNNGTRTVAFACEGLSTGPAVSTRINGCNLKIDGVTYASAPQYNLPGPLVATASYTTTVPSNKAFEVCVSVTTTYIVGDPTGARDCTDLVHPIA